MIDSRMFVIYRAMVLAVCVMGYVVVESRITFRLVEDARMRIFLQKYK